MRTCWLAAAAQLRCWLYCNFKGEVCVVQIITRSITAEGPVAYDEEIFALAQKLMQSVKWIEGVRLLGVSVAHLEPADAVPVLNFAEDERLGKRNQAVDILKAKFGEDIIKRGF